MKVAETTRSRMESVPRPSSPSPHQSSLSPLASAKIAAGHRERLAMVYVRQSTPQQVAEHRESLARQYALKEHAQALGWPVERVVVIDDDLGLSGRSATARKGFQRLLAEVALNHVGIVLGLEMSRLARSCKDWHHLLELCGVFGTLLGDQDGVYDPGDPNDRLLLGLRGTISEVELHTMRNRLQRGLLNKAQRGELFLHLPMGYLRTASGEVGFDPDEQVQSTVRLIFDKFEELGTISGVFCYLVRHGIRLGVRSITSPDCGQLHWRQSCRTTLANLLQHPIYAGAYVYGRRQSSPQRKLAGKINDPPSRQMDRWQVLMRDRLPAYITWDQFLENQRRIAQNRSRWEVLGPCREGPTLLAGLICCGGCGHRLQVHYRRRGQGAYVCNRKRWDPSVRNCPSVPASALDGLIAEQVLRALEPASVELSLAAVADVERERDRLNQHWKRRLERAGYEAARAARQYHAVEPENRLVARTLERQWETALERHRQLEEEYDRFRRDAPVQLTDETRDRIVALAADIPSLWYESGISAADRQQIVRLVVERVVAKIQADSESVDVTIFWAGGYSSQHRLRRSVQGFEQLVDFESLERRIRELLVAHKTSAQIAERLNRDGFNTPRRQGKFTADIVRRFVSTRKMTGLRRSRSQPSLEGD